MPYQVQSELFEGPLDLLLYLVTKEKLDITDVSLAKVAEEYWAYLKMLEALDLDVESSYLVVFACLLELKSRVLLPPEPEDPIDVGDLDLGDTAEHDLVEKLREYKKFKEASRLLSEREKEELRVFPRPVPDPAPESPGEGVHDFDVSLPDLLDALRRLLEAQKERQRSQRQIRLERVAVSVPQRMKHILELLEPGRPVGFYELFGGEVTRAHIIVTFLAMLELTRLRRIRIWQEERSGPIFVELRVRLAEDARTEIPVAVQMDDEAEDAGPTAVLEPATEVLEAASLQEGEAPKPPGEVLLVSVEDGEAAHGEDRT